MTERHAAGYPAVGGSLATETAVSRTIICPCRIRGLNPDECVTCTPASECRPWCADHDSDAGVCYGHPVVVPLERLAGVRSAADRLWMLPQRREGVASALVQIDTFVSPGELRSLAVKLGDMADRLEGLCA